MTMQASSLRALGRTLRHPITRVTSARLRLLPALAWGALALLAAGVARSQPQAVSRALGGAFGGLALPLLALSCLVLVCPEGTLVEAGRPLLVLGATARRAALTMGLAVVGLAALGAGAVGALVVCVAHGPTDPPLAMDVATSASVAALGGAAYASYFTMGSALFGRHGGSALFVVDFLLGSMGVGALFTPRAHVRALFGGALAAHVTPRLSSVALVAMVLVFLGIAAWRSRPR